LAGETRIRIAWLLFIAGPGAFSRAAVDQGTGNRAGAAVDGIPGLEARPARDYWRKVRSLSICAGQFSLPVGGSDLDPAKTFAGRPEMLDGYIALMASESLTTTQPWLHRRTELRYTNKASFDREITRVLTQQEKEIRKPIQSAAMHGFPPPDIHLRAFVRAFSEIP
jgi:hypothetical protein